MVIEIAWTVVVVFALWRDSDNSPPFEIVLNSPNILFASDRSCQKEGF